jgi:hypothetical protein
LSILTFSAATLTGLSLESQDLDPKTRFGLALQACQEAAAKGLPGKCKLYGKIKVVESFPDVKIKVVESFPDIKVKVVESFPDKPGKWKMVNSFPDYKIKFVDSFPDYKIKYVESFPGCD